MSDTVNAEEMDYDSMSSDELDSILNNAERNTETSEESDEQEDQDTIEPSKEVQGDNEEPTGQTQEETPQKDNEEPMYKGKSREEILEMQKNANRKISKQNNEIYQLKKRLDGIEETQETKATQKEKESIEATLSNYESNDVDAIKKIVDMEFKKRETEKRNQTEAQKKQVMSEHDDMWANLEVFNPALFDKIKDSAMQEMQENQEGTYLKKGWLKQYISERASEPISVPKKTVKKRTGTVSAGGVSNNGGQAVNKSVDDMTAQEFESHMLSKGHKF